MSSTKIVLKRGCANLQIRAMLVRQVLLLGTVTRFKGEQLNICIHVESDKDFLFNQNVMF